MSGVSNWYGPRGGVRSAGRVRNAVRGYGSNKRRRRMPRSGGEFYGELRQSSRRLGRTESRRGVRYAKHLLRATVQRNIYGMSNWSAYGGKYGAVPLLNFWKANAPQSYLLPVHLYDLTCAPNNVNGTVYDAQCGYTLNCDNVSTSTALLNWQCLGNAVSVVRSGHTSGSTAGVPNASSLLRAASIKLMLYAPTAIPIKYCIQLVQFPDEDYAPASLATVTGVDYPSNWSASGTAGVSLNAPARSWWLNKLQPYARSPVVHSFREGAPKMNVLYTKTIIMNPKETTEVANTKYHQFNLFKALNRQCTYAYEADKRWNVLDASTEVTETADNHCSVHPSKRIFLMIRALAAFGSANTAFVDMNTDISIDGATVKPYTGFGSYDISLRLYHDDVGS